MKHMSKAKKLSLMKEALANYYITEHSDKINRIRLRLLILKHIDTIGTRPSIYAVINMLLAHNIISLVSKEKVANNKTLYKISIDSIDRELKALILEPRFEVRVKSGSDTQFEQDMTKRNGKYAM